VNWSTVIWRGGAEEGTMRDIEGALRGAMADDVAGVSLPAGMAGRVRARHRRHRRVRLTAAVAGLAAIVVAVPLVTDAVLRDTATPPPADAPVVDEVDGVAVTYLPDGLARDPVDGFDIGGAGDPPDGWTAVTGRWRPEGVRPGAGYDRGVRLTVFRGQRPDLLWVLARTSGVLGEDEPLPDEQDGRVVVHTPVDPAVGDGNWVDVFWHATDEVTLRVRVSADLEPVLERIIDGIRVVGDGEPVPFGADRDSAPPAADLCAPQTNREIRYDVGGHDWSGYGGVDVRVVPAELAGGGFSWSTAARGLVDTAESGRWMYRFDWRFAGDDGWPFTVRVTCGDRAPRDVGSLERFVAGSGTQPLEPVPYQRPDGRPAFTVMDHFDASGWGQRVAWLVRPGAVVEVSVTDGLVGYVDEIVAGVALHGSGGDVREEPAVWCPSPAVRPTALPWVADGEPLPEPDHHYSGPSDVGWAWLADPADDAAAGPYVQLVRVATPVVEPGERFGFDREVRGHPAESVWVGDPGNSVIHVSWREADADCGVYRLSVNSRGIAPLLGEQWAAGGRCAAGGDPVDDGCIEEFHRAFSDELARILDSLVSD
jgi:hypothetical protein